MLHTAPNCAISEFEKSTVNPEPRPLRPNHVLTTYRWPLVIVVLGFLVLFAYLAILWVLKRTYDETVIRGGRVGHLAAQKAEAIAEKFISGHITRTFVAAI